MITTLRTPHVNHVVADPTNTETASALSHADPNHDISPHDFEYTANDSYRTHLPRKQASIPLASQLALRLPNDGAPCLPATHDNDAGANCGVVAMFLHHLAPWTRHVL